MSEKSEIQFESTNYETNIISTLSQNEVHVEPHKINIKENSNTSELKKESSNVVVMRNFYVISFGYVFFTLTDSGLRMIVLLQLYDRHFNALQISIMFTLYEFFGVIINLTGGIMGSRLGIRVCLVSGLFVQVVGIAMLCGLQGYWSSWSSLIIIIYVTIAQGFSGIAKDLVKLAGKSVTKLVTTDDSLHQTSLFELVAWITGAKNSVKGAGFFWGALLLLYTGYIPALLILLITNLIIIPFALIYIDYDLAVSKSKKKLTFKEIFDKGRDINILSFARMFLFGSRDLWFEVPLPLFLRGPVGWSYLGTGALLAGWIIFYGTIQSSTPQLILKPLGIYPIKSGRLLVPFTILLLLITIFTALFLKFITLEAHFTLLLIILITGLFIFAFIFAINSSIHSFLILAYCHRDKVAMNVGFYYMANAFGRLVGLIVGGVLYYFVGLDACLWMSVGALIFCAIVSFFRGPIPESQDEKAEA
ncbi:major facilitator transporter [Gigaspora margarita]|uniref:Major facilitator transporter n=1 Tax=Gigaspora margarita TaxID=4874 RepID=A0A8H4AHU3_GIGMA|nr:major facilitator transporter [Gigaspora margarita]